MVENIAELAKVRVLIIEDNNGFSQLAKRYLDMLSEKIEIVAVAGEGVDACEMIAKHDPDAILMAGWNKGVRKPKNDLWATVTNILRDIGMNATTDGYFYLREAIILAIGEPALLKGLTKELYPAVAKKFETKSYLVEKAMRYAIEDTWANGNKDAIDEYFEIFMTETKEKPPNGRFISYVTYLVKAYMDKVNMPEDSYNG